MDEQLEEILHDYKYRFQARISTDILLNLEVGIESM